MPLRVANAAPTYPSGLLISVPPPASEPAASITSRDHAAPSTALRVQRCSEHSAKWLVAVACGLEINWMGLLRIRNVGDTKIA